MLIICPQNTQLLSGRLEFQSRPSSSQFSKPREMQRGMGSLELSHLRLSYGSANSNGVFEILLFARVPQPLP